LKVYLPPSLQFEARHLAMSTWIDHLPFANDLIVDKKPKLLVELGTYSGLSFFAFCQAMAENNVPGLAYAIDSWEGDEHTGDYGEEIFRKVEYHAREHYSGFTYLLRMRFEEALPQFDADSIDILHIDGLHTYAAVKQDFEQWYPKVRPGGIVLFHDIEARLPEFGVRQYWEEIKPEHTSFDFQHGYGLGVIRKPGGEALTELESLLFDSDSKSQEALRGMYVHLARYHDVLRKLKRKEGQN